MLIYFIHIIINFLLVLLTLFVFSSIVASLLKKTELIDRISHFRRNKIVALSVGVIILLIFFNPRPGGYTHHGNPYYWQIKTCSCIGLQISVSGIDTTWRYCLGIPYSCREETKEKEGVKIKEGEIPLISSLAEIDQYLNENIKVRGKLSVAGGVIYLESGESLRVCCGIESQGEFDDQWVEVTGLLEPSPPVDNQYTANILHFKQIKKIQPPEVDLTEEEKAIIEEMKRQTPLSCDPWPIPGKVEVYFKDDDPYFSEKDAKKIVEAFPSPVSISESTSFEQGLFYFDLKKELSLSKDEPIYPILEAKFKNIPKVKSFELVASGEKIEGDKLIILFIEQITPSEAEDIVKLVYPNAVVLFSNKTPHHKHNPVYFRLEVAGGKERGLVAFLRDNPKVKTVQRMFTPCIVP